MSKVTEFNENLVVRFEYDGVEYLGQCLYKYPNAAPFIKNSKINKLVIGFQEKINDKPYQLTLLFDQMIENNIEMFSHPKN